MSLFVTSGRVVSAAWKNFARNAWLALTTVFVLMLCLLSVNVLIGVNVLVRNAVTILEDKIDITVYFKNGTSPAILEQARFFMGGLPQVKSASLISAEDALAAFKERHKDDPKILGALEDIDSNPLGATLTLKANKTSDYPFLLEALQNPQFDFAIESKSYDNHAETIEQVRSVSRSVTVFGYGLVSVFALFSVLIVFNTVRVAIYTQREEIAVMRLVGASSAYVRLPFVLEGILLALLALGISGLMVFAAASALDPRLAAAFGGTVPGLRAYFLMNAPQLAMIEGGALSALVALSSWAAVGKYLKR
ncbi:permease-like cell division protein FtsX [Patescibacteria group bacterium]|nr:permease-like cell division protein FtsX [Patescibacteria group bacterium]